jgi:FkbM family methyltransferase
MKRLIKTAFRRAGLEIKRTDPESPEDCTFQMMKWNDINLVLDVGANVGQYGLRLRSAGYSGRIISFEPLRSAFTLLTKHCQKDGRWEAHNIAVGSQSQQETINVSANSYSSSLLTMLNAHLQAAPSSKIIRQESVAMATLDAMVHLNESDRIMLKIDTQGYEHCVLQGATSTLTKVRLIQCEVSLVPLYQNQLLFWELLGLLQQSGFVPVAFERAFSDPESGYALQVDGTFRRASSS